MKQLTPQNYPSDEAIQRLFYSKDPADNKIAAIFTVKKYVYKDAIQEFLERASRNYLTKRHWDKFEQKDTTLENKVYIYVSREAFVQIIVGSYGLWCKSLIREPEQQRKTIIEYI